MDSIPGKLGQKVKVFELMEDRQDRIDALIGASERFQPVPERIATAPYPKENRVPGCESEVYVFPEPLDDGTLKFHFAVENPQGISAMALAVILDETLSGEPLKQVARIPPEVIFEFFGKELSMGKSMGLTGMAQMVRSLAAREIEEQAARGEFEPPEITPEEIERIEKAAVEELRQIMDPEVPVNVYDLGLIYRIRVDQKARIGVVMTLTAPNCPEASTIPIFVKARLGRIDGVTDVQVVLVWEPPWRPDMASPAALLELNMM